MAASAGPVPTAGDLCEHHAGLAAELGRDTVANGDHTKKRSARQRTPVDAESEPLEVKSHGFGRPSAVRPALALTAAEEVETIRRVLLEAATSTPASHGRPAVARNAARASDRRSRCPITAPASKLSRRSCARGSAGSERPRSSSRRFRS